MDSTFTASDEAHTQDNTNERAGLYPIGITAAELQSKTFAPIRWVVPGILPEGVTLLSGKPKMGKS